MSKLAENIRAFQIDERRSTPSPVLSLDSSIEELPFPEGRLYRFKATLGYANAFVVEPDAVPNMLRATRTHVVEEVFGEFRENFNELERALLHRDLDGAIRALIVFRTKMFEV